MRNAHRARHLHRFPLLLLGAAVCIGLLFQPLQEGAAGPPAASPKDTVGTTLYLPLVINSPLPPAELEITQAVQQPDNAVVLIANRPTYVRYTLTDDYAFGGVDAFLYGSRNGSPLPGSPLPALNNPRTLETSANRADWNDTFDFELPESWASGTVTLWTHAVNGTDYEIHEGPVSVTFHENDPLAVTLVPIAYTCTSGGTGTITPSPPYTYLDDYTFKIYPVPSVDMLVHAPAAYAGPCSNGLPTPSYNTTDGGDWRALLDLVTGIRAAEGYPDRYYYGLVEIYCGSSCISGLGWIGSRAAVGWNGYGSSHTGASNTHAHEVGHNHGRSHAPGCGASGVDTAYPYVDGSGRALIGDAAHPNFDFDVDTMAITPYTAAYDFMSYCNPDWISDYNYEALYAWESASPSIAMDNSQTGESLLVTGTLLPDGSVDLLPTFKLEIPASPPTSGPYSLELFDAAGEILAVHPFDLLTAAVDRYGGGPGGEFQGFQVAVPAIPGIEGLRIVKAGRTLGEINRPQAQAGRSAGLPQPAIENRLLQLPGGLPVTAGYLVRISIDGGATWQTVAVGPAAAVGPVDLSAFSGRSVTVQVLESSGLDTQEVTLGPVQIP